MRVFGVASKVLAVVWVIAAPGGCEEECPTQWGSIGPGATAPGGVDPAAAFSMLMPETVPLWWAQINETTTLTITTTASDKASTAYFDCQGDNPSYSVPATVTLETSDGRLRASLVMGTYLVDGAGVLKPTPSMTGSLPVSTLIGTGIVSDALLDPNNEQVSVWLELIAAGAGVAYGEGSLAVTGGKTTIYLAKVNPTP